MGREKIDESKLYWLIDSFNSSNDFDSNYYSENFGNTYLSVHNMKAAEKRAEQEAARARAARSRQRKKHGAAALQEKAKGALDGAKSALDISTFTGIQIFFIISPSHDFSALLLEPNSLVEIIAFDIL